jgi:DNA polymerase III epsilon subunit-like protein
MTENNSPYVLYVVDCETTGTDPVKHDVIEVCFWRLSDDECRTWCLKPLDIEAIDDRALKVNKHKRDDLIHKTAKGRETYLDPKDVLPEIEMWIMQDGVGSEDRVFIGQNPEFDYGFLVEMWEKLGTPETFPFGFWRGEGSDRKNLGFLIDTIQIARFIDLCIGRKRRWYNLGSLVKAFSITKAVAHRADGDVKMTKDLFLKMMEGFKSAAVEHFDDCYIE